MTTIRDGLLPLHWRQTRQGPIKLACLHSTESLASADDGNKYDARRPDEVSCHAHVDGREIVREVPIASVAFTMAPWNDVTVNIEQRGLARWASEEWQASGVLESTAWYLANEWPGPLDIWSGRQLIRYVQEHQVVEAGALPAGVTAHRWLNETARFFGDAWCRRVLGRTSSDLSHTDPGPAYLGDYVGDDRTHGLIDDVVARARQLRGGGPVPAPGKGTRVLTRITVTDHWAVFYGDMDEQGAILNIVHAGPALNDKLGPLAAKSIERSRPSMVDFTCTSALPFADRPGVPEWTSADFNPGR